MKVYSLQMLAGGVGAYCWMLLARHVSPPRLLCLAGLAQLSLFAPVYWYEYMPSKRVSFVVALMQGLASGAVEPVIVGFNFMGPCPRHSKQEPPSRPETNAKRTRNGRETEPMRAD